jgi:LuxR family maltose regulon positive regulatory protein
LISRDATPIVASGDRDPDTFDSGARWLRLRAPQLRGRIVRRDRLLAALAAARDSRVVHICAPAGYGKTILAAQMSEVDPRPGCWIALEESDNDPRVLLGDLTCVLARLGSAAPPGVEEASVEMAHSASAAQLAVSPPFLLVVDDVELVTDSDSLAALAFLVEHVPPGSQVVLCTRTEAPVRLARLRAAGDVLDLRAAALAFELSETRERLSAGGARLSDEQIEEIHRRTEGWPTGVALALRHGSRDVASYLIEEVVQTQPAELRRFLLASSLLERMSPALCDGALETADSGQMLAALEREGAFIVRLDRDGDWYRYHRLFREVLQAEVERGQPESVAPVLARAATWHDDHGEPREAFEYAHAAGDLALAGGIAMRSSETLVARGELAQVREWLTRCTPEEIASDPQLALAGAWTSLLTGDAAEAWRLAAVAGTATDLDAPSPGGATSLRSSLASLHATVASDGISQMLRDGEVLVAAERAAGTRAVMYGWRQIGTAHLLDGRPDEAIAAFAEVLLRAKGHADLDHLTVYALGYSALAAADMGDWRRARKWAREAHAMTTESGLGNAPQSAAPFAAHATVLLHDSLLPQARRALEHARGVIPMLHAMRWFEADISLRCAELGLDLGDVECALELADVTRSALSHYPDPGGLAARLRALDSRLSSGGELDLTPSEMRLIPFLSSHLSLQEIGDRIYLSRATVKTHLDSIYRKLGVSSRSAAVERLEALGLCHRPPWPAAAWQPAASP